MLGVKMKVKKTFIIFLLLIVAVLVLCTGCAKTENAKIATPLKPQIVIYVGGSVTRPGQYTITGGSNISQAIQLAGGLLPDADISKVNLNEIIDNTLYINIPQINQIVPRDHSANPVRAIQPLNNSQDVSERQPGSPKTPVIRDNNMTALELQMLDWVNYERTSRGVHPLSLDRALVKAARLKSQDLIDNNYFDHQSPRYGSPSNLLLSQGISFLCAGENLAKVSTLERGHTGLMNSPGHRENILRPEFGKIGIGIIDQGRLGLMITQEFTD